MNARTAPLVIAHRGYSAGAPENTLAAFEAALRVGADLLELDVAMDAEGIPVVIHDDTLERTSDALGNVADLTAAQLRSIDAGSWFSPAYTGQRIPTLADVVALVARHPGAGLLVEFKGSWSPAEVHVAAAVVRAGGIADRSILQSFDRGTVAALRDVAPDVRRALLVIRAGEEVELTDVIMDPFTALASSREEARVQATEARTGLGVMACNPYVGCVAAGPEVVAGYHDAAVQSFPWTVDDPALWRELLRAGVDGIITNDPGRLRGFLDARELQLAQDLPSADREQLTRSALRQGRMPVRAPGLAPGLKPAS